MVGSSAFALLGLAALGSAHMLMDKPVPYGVSSLNNSPLAADGSDFPCKQRPGVYETEGASNTIALGGEMQVSFKGSAIHGGGSCQFSVTYDKTPSADSDWKVVHSIEGGCPMKGVDGNLPENPNGQAGSYSFKFPTNLPTGQATFAWTWFNKIGNREMYMNCAPMTITGGSGGAKVRRSPRLDARDQSAYQSLPNMFVANIGGQCATTEGGDLAFPNPGQSLDLFGSGNTINPLGDACGKSVLGGGSGGNGGVVNNEPPKESTPQPQDTTPPAPESNGQVPPVTPPSTEVADGVTPPPAGTGGAIPGGAFVEVGDEEQDEETTPEADTPAQPIDNKDAPVSTEGSMTGSCSTEGAYNCIDGSSFQRCASGTWSVVQQMAQGTTCKPGQSDSLTVNTKRELFGRRSILSHF